MFFISSLGGAPRVLSEILGGGPPHETGPIIGTISPHLYHPPIWYTRPSPHTSQSEKSGGRQPSSNGSSRPKLPGGPFMDLLTPSPRPRNLQTTKILKKQHNLPNTFKNTMLLWHFFKNLQKRNGFVALFGVT